MRRLLALLVTLPLVLAGSFAAHQAGFAFAAPAAAQRGRLLAETGHAYLVHLPLVLVALGSVVAIGGLLAVRAELRSPRAACAASWPYALVAPAAFAVQEHLERLLHGGRPPLDLLAEPAFVAGLALQVPVALLAVVLARLVLRSARRLARALGGRRPARLRPGAAPTALRPARSPAIPRPAILASGAAGRAPPLSLAA